MLQIQDLHCFLRINRLRFEWVNFPGCGSLHPIGSWSGPFGPARLLLPGWLTWWVVYIGGLLLLGFILS